MRYLEEEYSRLRKQPVQCTSGWNVPEILRKSKETSVAEIKRGRSEKAVSTKEKNQRCTKDLCVLTPNNGYY